MKHQFLKTTPEISKRMSKVKTKRNKPETLLAKALWHKGYRYYLNNRKLIGTPDITITKFNIAIFIDGEFWHGKDIKEFESRNHNNKEYWLEKIQENIKHDSYVIKKLQQDGWNVIRFWSKDIMHYLDDCITVIEDYIQSSYLE